MVSKNQKSVNHLQVEEEFSLSVLYTKMKELRNSTKRHDIGLAISLEKENGLLVPCREGPLLVEE